jgi:histidinol-phosphatase (PHP family)
MREYLVAQGVKTAWHLVRAAEAQEGDEKVGKRGRVVARPVTGWEDDGFWETFKATM